MGHKEGSGLGKHGQGRTQIVEASQQRGRRGLGMVVSGLEPTEDIDWDFTKEEVIPSITLRNHYFSLIL